MWGEYSNSETASQRLRASKTALACFIRDKPGSGVIDRKEKSPVVFFILYITALLWAESKLALVS